jgi:hypothetical protein
MLILLCLPMAILDAVLSSFESLWETQIPQAKGESTIIVME